MSKEIIIENTYPGEHPIYLKLSNGDKVRISSNQSGFIGQLQELPLEARIKLMMITSMEMADYYETTRKKVIDDFKQMLKTKWYAREDDSIEYDFNDETLNDMVMGVKMNKKQLLSNTNKLPFAFFVRAVEEINKEYKPA